MTFKAFHEFHRKLYMRYAHIQMGTGREAEKVVDRVFADLKRRWGHVQEQPSVPDYAWKTLREEVQRWLDERGLPPQVVGTGAFTKALQRLWIHEMRDALTVLPQEIGLYAAIAKLPDRRYDVIVLRFMLGMEEDATADYLGCDKATVRSHVRHARRQIAAELGLPHHDPDHDAEQ
ncbi:sigma-70 family RNA polymerase sigma factor [Streptomyces sp. LP05-1]|uniref:Sigma-70 family RNA polymerase sigma factor n=1 Tax=Streptomyces pyxinae TaxID=2970734 RepID=A0ABT2CC97_9ACTN|nr:sigma factor-like helix-turn-helix DNA-binding protein [Streptomyces sp. LP05-1]MCS0634742.1 sigma-70 family RNA polymerase sigma factor [Streptomyces sp. LP05-1]